MRTAGPRRVTALALTVGLAAAACSSGADATGGDRPVVVGSFYPLAAAAEVVGGGLVSVEDLTPAGVEPHDLELAPDDVEAVLTADVVVLVGGGFQPAVEEAAREAEGVVVDVLDAVDTLPPPEGLEGDLAADPHVWLDPERYASIVRRVADVLADLAPGDASAFRSNADAYVDELDRLDADFADGLARCAGRTMVVNHAAFAYVADAYGLEQVAISGVSPEAEPDPARLAELQDLVEREGVRTIFTEELASPEVAETLASEAGVRTAVLNPLEGLTDEQIAAGEDYVSVMRDNLTTLRAGLDCA
jgi:zinc transport system substrate-binding protein